MRVGCPIGAFFLANGLQTCISLETKIGRISKDASVFFDVSVNPVISYKLYSEVNLITSCETVRSGS